MKNLLFLIVTLVLLSSCAKESLESLTPSMDEINSETNEVISLKEQQTDASSFQFVLPNAGDKLRVQVFSNANGGNAFITYSISKVTCVKNKFTITANTPTKVITIQGRKDIMKKIDVDECSSNVTNTFYTYIFTAKMTSTTNYFYDGFYDTKPNYGCGASGIYDPTNCPGACWATPKLVASETSNTNIMYVNW